MACPRIARRDIPLGCRRFGPAGTGRCRCPRNGRVRGYSRPGAVLIPRVRALRPPGEVDGPAAPRRVLTGQQRNAGHHGVEGEVRQRHRLQYLGAQPVFDDTSRHGSGLLHGAGLLGRGRCRCGGADSDLRRGMPQPGAVRIGHALHPAFLPEAQVDMRIAHPPRDRRIFRLACRVAREPRPRAAAVPIPAVLVVEHRLLPLLSWCGRFVCGRTRDLCAPGDRRQQHRHRWV
uniref:Uncharacterized protein n=1 Tax=Rhodococcus sp. NS1 TaxID=402236 RepID=Q06GB7_9NOCA|nr:hypothetical protein PNSL1.066 [Rhodococcus sp. NS1]